MKSPYPRAMDKYERFLRDVIDRTEEDKLRWSTGLPQRAGRFLYNYDDIVRSFSCEYRLGGKSYTLAFVEKKIQRPDEWGQNFDVFDGELLVVDDDGGELVVRIDDALVEAEDLNHLISLVTERNALTREFFAAFEDPVGEPVP